MTSSIYMMALLNLKKTNITSIASWNIAGVVFKVTVWLCIYTDHDASRMQFCGRFSQPLLSVSILNKHLESKIFVHFLRNLCKHPFLRCNSSLEWLLPGDVNSWKTSRNLSLFATNIFGDTHCVVSGSTSPTLRICSISIFSN